MSESQERMMAVVTPENLDGFLAICAKWDVNATVIGTVNDTGRLTMRWHGETDRRRPAAHAGPRRPGLRPPDRPPGRPGRLDRRRRRLTSPVPAPATSCGTTLLRLAARPNLADKSWVTDQYDRYVMGNTVLAQPEDAGLIRIADDSDLGVALATDGNGRYTRLDPYAGAQLALAEAYRNVATTGARPIAVTNCLNFGSPEDPGVMWQFSEAVRGLADGVPATRRPGHRRQRQLLQPDRDDARSCRRRSSACSA